MGENTRSKLLLAGALLSFFLIFVNFRSGLSISALDIGQGDCLVIRSGKKCYVVDSGSSSERDIGSDIVLPYLKYHGITAIDAIFISHADNDHISGVKEMLEMVSQKEVRMKIGRIIMSSVMQEDEAAQEILSLGNRYAGGVLYVEAGDSFVSGNLKFDILYPGDSFTGDRNMDSMVLKVSNSSFSALFTGDIEGQPEKSLASDLSHCDLLKVAHHGSSGSSSEEFLERVRPAAALISCGRNNRYGHPHPETLERLEEAGADVYVTAERGEIIVSIEPDGAFSVRCFFDQT